MADVHARELAAPAPGASVVPLLTRATLAFIERPVMYHGLSAREVLRGIARERFAEAAERRARIEAALERLADLRDALIAKLDAMDADPDLEPWLGRTEAVDQLVARIGARDDREEGDDLEPSLGSIGRVDQRAWALSACDDGEAEHDGREPEDAF